MKLRFHERLLTVRERKGEGSARTVVEGSVNLPGHLPPAHRMVLVEVQVDRYRAHPEGDRILIEGACSVRAVYAAAPDEGRDRLGEAEREGARLRAQAEALFSASWPGGIPFTLLVDAEGVGPEDAVRVDVAVREVEWDLTAGGRQLDVDAVLEARAAAYAYETSRVPLAEGALPPGALVDPIQVRAVSLTPELTVEGHTAGELALSPAYPAAERILRVEAVPRVGRVDVGAGRLTAQVDMGYRILYAPLDPGEGQAILARFQAETPFELEASVNTLQEGMELQLEPLAVPVEASLRDQGRRLWVEAHPRFRCRPYQRLPLTLAERVQAEGAEVAERQVTPVLVELVADLERHQETTAVLELPRGKPLIEQVLDVTAQPLIESVHVGADRVTAKVVLACSLLYAARVDDDSRPLFHHHWPQALTVEVELPVPGAEPDMEAELWATVEQPVADLINRETTELHGQLVVRGRLTRRITPEVVAEAVSLPAEERPEATFIFVRVEPDDTLWGLAQRYGVSEEEVRACNPGLADAADPEAALHQLRKICLPGTRSLARETQS